MQKLKAFFIVLILICSSCVSKRVFHEEIHKRDVQISSLESEIEMNESRLQKHEEMIAAVSSSSQEALERAQEAGMLAKGKFLYEIQLSDDSCKFDMNQISLEGECKVILDDFIERIKKENQNVYIEIQGHTDSTGDENLNYVVGKKRAEAVYGYLATHGNFPLHRMNVISYGESQPIADNSTVEGRRANRRVNIVVLE